MLFRFIATLERGEGISKIERRVISLSELEDEPPGRHRGGDRW